MSVASNDYLHLEEESNDLPVDLNFIRNHFKISLQESDEYIKKLLKIAISQAETYTDRSIVLKKWVYTHNQVQMHLPKPPIAKINSVEVMKNGKFENIKDYCVQKHNDYMILELNKNKYMNKKVRVKYSAGFEKEEDLPSSILQYLLNRFEVLYNGSAQKSDNLRNHNVLLDSFKIMRNKL
ncbi:hypothetical protein FZC35_01520 [Candidatus Cytomitobacter indipagum]|uniref:Phage gp6-like head-tail connector protein n=1 Tax=Candidatus Cytomitobacter indipagum TaxID=2601575 RepID=A0A5C0UEC5_9PROT|nr:hypothetical protein [Candidatus Cytomitobacter indipagum]QEK38050.1 hypothetical protein FZC35_01520 [Candidatus Cytomitobacter indipagum]